MAVIKRNALRRGTPKTGDVELPSSAGSGSAPREVAFYAHPFQASHAYAQDALIAHNDNLYRATAGFTSGGAFSASDWTLVGTGNGIELPLEITQQAAQLGVLKDGGMIRFFGEGSISKDDFVTFKGAGTAILPTPPFDVSIYEDVTGGENSAQVYVSTTGSDPQQFNILCFYLYTNGLVPYVWLGTEPTLTNATSLGFCFNNTFMAADDLDALP